MEKQWQKQYAYLQYELALAELEREKLKENEVLEADEGEKDGSNSK